MNHTAIKKLKKRKVHLSKCPRVKLTNDHGNSLLETCTNQSKYTKIKMSP